MFRLILSDVASLFSAPHPWHVRVAHAAALACGIILAVGSGLLALAFLVAMSAG